METALILGGIGCALLFLSIFAVGAAVRAPSAARRKLGRYPYRAKPNGTYDNSSMGSPR
ncbi:hypothetical protein PV367_14855 [Streptomyces europaeiscabiei]|uniref:Uncharacterized protein n=1 Tax=Streptomyces europaeiscabiei TaxID=146819 RepID=A0AAJ2PP17_9ACTN|nr:hypothetical protein [Streptomyces europaeiscabiei]MDX3131037.1 hypothetical protein [Streptomyces europaeiscabiei]